MVFQRVLPLSNNHQNFRKNQKDMSATTAIFRAKPTPVLVASSDTDKWTKEAIDENILRFLEGEPFENNIKVGRMYNYAFSKMVMLSNYAKVKLKMRLRVICEASRLKHYEVGEFERDKQDSISILALVDGMTKQLTIEK